MEQIRYLIEEAREKLTVEDKIAVFSVWAVLALVAVVEICR